MLNLLVSVHDILFEATNKHWSGSFYWPLAIKSHSLLLLWLLYIEPVSQQKHFPKPWLLHKKIDSKEHLRLQMKGKHSNGFSRGHFNNMLTRVTLWYLTLPPTEADSSQLVSTFQQLLRILYHQGVAMRLPWQTTESGNRQDCISGNHHCIFAAIKVANVAKNKRTSTCCARPTTKGRKKASLFYNYEK